ncbi:MAG: CHAP domain-containing protein [Actinomycetota bacterium]|nr:CHAP domain-containing protein [Actinomycetota bacterium]
MKAKRQRIAPNSTPKFDLLTMLGIRKVTVTLFVALLTLVQLGQAPNQHPRPIAIRYKNTAYSHALLTGFGDAPSINLPPTEVPHSIIVAAQPTKGGGYYFVTAQGQLLTYGNAINYGDTYSLGLYAPIVAMALTPDQKGYYFVAADGGVFAFGDATFYGSMGGIKLNNPVVSIKTTSDGKGYYLVASDGGIFAFGDATFYGSMGGEHLNGAIVDMATTSDGKGYWLVGADGGIFSFGDATFYGSLGNISLNASIAGMAATPDHRGYWIVGNDGGVFTFGDATFYGSVGGEIPNTPISQVVPSSDGLGYQLLSPDSIAVIPTLNQTERTTQYSQAIIDSAQSQVGPATQPNFCNPYGPCEEWCALFTAWTWNQNGVPLTSDGFTGDLYNEIENNYSVLPESDQPAAGDVVFYGTGPQNTSTSVHAGIVIQVWPDGALTTVEGDSGPGPAGWLGVTMNGPYIKDYSAEINGAPIYGFGEA